MEKNPGFFLREKKRKTINTIRRQLDATAEDFRGLISENKTPSFDWIVSKLKYNDKKIIHGRSTAQVNIDPMVE